MINIELAKGHSPADKEIIGKRIEQEIREIQAEVKASRVIKTKYNSINLDSLRVEGNCIDLDKLRVDNNSCNIAKNKRR